MKIASIVPKIIAFAALAAASNCYSQVYKCVNRSGNIEFSNIACAAGSSGGKMRIETNDLDMSGAREQVLITENSELHQQLRNQSNIYNDSGTNRIGRTEADLQAERASSYECRTAKKNTNGKPARE